MSTQHEEQAWIPTVESLGARLALIRQHMKWNIKEAALACDIPAANWTEWETKGRSPRDLVEVAGKIATRTGADDYWIITGRPLRTVGGGDNHRPLDYKGEGSVVHVDFATRRQLATTA